jgi:hypothetical protein
MFARFGQNPALTPGETPVSLRSSKAQIGITVAITQGKGDAKCLEEDVHE